jgi:hypothetical protein
MVTQRVRDSTMLRPLLLGALIASSLLSCSSEKLNRVPAPGTHTETFDQAAASKIDLLWVIDNSGSMADKQAKVAASLSRFIDVFARGNIDYRVAVTTSDAFAHVPGSAGSFFHTATTPEIIRPTDDDPLAEFQQNIKVGTQGSGDEQGLASAKLALDLVTHHNAPILDARAACVGACGASGAPTPCVKACQTQHEPDFLRPEAYLYVICVSDEDDHSGEEAIFYGRYLETVKGAGNAGQVAASAIVGDPAGVACTATPGLKYAGVAAYTGGIIGSICEPTFDQNLTRLAQDAVGLQSHFLLGALPRLETLQLEVAYRCDTPHIQLASCKSVDDTCAGSAPEVLGLLCTPPPSSIVAVDASHPEGFTAGWSYQCADNSISFHRDATSNAVPGLRSQLRVTFVPGKDLQCSP